MLDHWVQVLAGQSQTPDPPKYTKCIKQQHAAENGRSQRGARTSASTLKETCQRQYAALRAHALGYLITAQWLVAEAAARGLGPDMHEVRAIYKEQKAAKFPGGNQEYDEFLAMNGRTPTDVMLETRLEVASARLLRTATAQQ